MIVETIETPNESFAERRLPWHKPEVVRLAVVLDTRSAVGSSSDDAVSAAPTSPI